MEGEGHVEHQIAKGISKRTVGALGVVFGLGVDRVPVALVLVLRAESRSEGGR